MFAAVVTADSPVTSVVKNRVAERHTANEIAQTLRAGVRAAGPVQQKEVNAYIKRLIEELREQWEAERRRQIVCPFDFPDL